MAVRGRSIVSSDAQLTFGRLVLRYRQLIGGLLIAITAVMFLAMLKVRIATSFADFFPREHRNVRLYQRFKNSFGGAQSLIVVIKANHGDIFNYATLKKIQDITFAVDGLPGVNHQSVRSLASYRITYPVPTPGALLSIAYMYPEVPKTKDAIKELERQVVIHRDSLKSLVSSDLREALVIETFNERGLNYQQLFQQIQGIVKQFQDPQHTIYVAGEPVVRGYGYYYLPIITLILFLSIAAMVGVLYLSLGNRSTWWIPIVTGSLSAIWGLGFVGWMGYNFDPVMLVIPLILTARDLSHGIQWQGRYYEQLDLLGDQSAACVTTTDYMIGPGFLSIVVDVAGIIFVSFGGIPVLQHIGLGGAVWLAGSLTMVFIFQPIFISYLPTPRLRERKRLNLSGADLLRRIVDGIVSIPVTPGPLRGAILIVSAVIVISGVLAGAGTKIGYSTPGTPLYRPSAKVNQDALAISRNFPLDEAWVVILTPGYPDPRSTLSPRVLRMVDDLSSFLLADPNVAQVTSFASSITKPFNQMFHNGARKFFAIPSSLLLSGNLWFLYLSGTAPDEMNYWISDHQASTMCIHILLHDHSYDTLARLQKELETFERERLASDPGLASTTEFAYLGGLGGLYAAANDVLFRLDLLNITFVLLVVFLFSALAFRSWVAAILFVLSCVLANFAAFIYLWVRGVGLTIDTVPVISLGIGLGVDYGIYIVARLRDEVIAGKRLEVAIDIALRHTGAAVLVTFAVMVGAVVPWIFSPLLFHNDMAVLLTFLMSTNMIAGALVLPAFIAWARPSFVSAYESAAESSVRTKQQIGN